MKRSQTNSEITTCKLFLEEKVFLKDLLYNVSLKYLRKYGIQQIVFVKIKYFHLITINKLHLRSRIY